MTLNHAAQTLTAILTLAGMLSFLLTGSLMMGMLVLIAPMPALWVQNSERQTWSVGEFLRGRRDDTSVADALDDAIRGPLPTRFEEDDTLFVPGVPRLDTSRFDGAGPDQTPSAPPTSTPIR